MYFTFLISQYSNTLNTASHLVSHSGLTVRVLICCLNILHLFVDPERKAYSHASMPKNVVPLTDDLVMSLNNKFGLWQVQGVKNAHGLVSKSCLKTRFMTFHISPIVISLTTKLMFFDNSCKFFNSCSTTVVNSLPLVSSTGRKAMKFSSIFTGTSGHSSSRWSERAVPGDLHLEYNQELS